MLRAWLITGLHNDTPPAQTANGQPLDQVPADENHIKDHSRRKIYVSKARLELTNCKRLDLLSYLSDIYIYIYISLVVECQRVVHSVGNDNGS